MTNRKVFIWFRIFGGIIAMVTVYILMFVNIQLDLTGYVPAPISYTFENMKDLFRRSSNITTGRTKTTNSMILTATDFYDGVKPDREQSFNASSSKHNNSWKYILWYNPPDWMNIEHENNMLTSLCAFDNCRMSTNQTDIQKYSAIIFSFRERLTHVPPISRKDRNPDQVWIFFYSESPVHHGKVAYRHENWRDTMNWSMGYNLDADIFRPYGVLEMKKEILERNYSAIFHRKTKLVAWAVSHCGAPSKRDDFVTELASYGVQIDIFGKCKDNKFKTHEELFKNISRNYKFYLSFENSLCKDYVTEKFFSYYNLDVVLIVRGGLDYDKYLPNDTFINTAHFNSAKELASYILRVGSSEESYTNYFRQKDRYTAKHVFQIPLTTCSLCKKLNNLNESRKSYGDHVSYMHENTCWNPTDISQTTLSLSKIVPFILLIILVVILSYRRLKFLYEYYLNNCSNI
ncbi:3-galactosyl-N-acetylglucosaminide 4-alpha-L-fucosyltransferase FUT3-like [Mercenaria mercenaria]|uniref:3-galactosyl-N-acetylglucosaminide 4-alpha-L-fucosyltransferase FUT3-like n=1 Tax=Mercenaria mercenaria TaxID=6596 RepID=UPI00234F8B12|nr:3-galactosyl-N-acetylglucosaminide 4-alpha-L-fucosyltransferase FUT3-like [Mercenaria mercenaria]XP_045189209.2 3-galactosyl-N-acetylglucosaminide 4-alpha-L-fucosyltransferase FUT3-like [Mercenaria mercenaria]XP_045189210.2 3-galactosyl-N-acetylglucosaminide 4-alpha-L-fucosyltransferase FUT3-like [Mercenaria mercenaria]